MRALEAELWWTFPAIKKQIDSLNEAEIIEIDKENTWWSIMLKKDLAPIFKELFFQSLKNQLVFCFSEKKNQISYYFWGDKFGKAIGMDLIIIYDQMQKEAIEKLKIDMNEIFRSYWIETASIVFMTKDEWDKRYRLADRFVLQVMRFYNNLS